MAKKKSAPVWLALLEGVGLALAVYLGLQLLFALLLVKGAVGESHVVPLLAAGCVAGVLCGGLFAIRRTSLGTMSCSLCVCGGFAAVLLLVCLGAYGQVALQGGGGVLLAAVLAAGVLTGLLGGRKKRRRRKP